MSVAENEDKGRARWPDGAEVERVSPGDAAEEFLRRLEAGEQPAPAQRIEPTVAARRPGTEEVFDREKAGGPDERDERSGPFDPTLVGMLALLGWTFAVCSGIHLMGAAAGWSDSSTWPMGAAAALLSAGCFWARRRLTDRDGERGD